MSRPVGIPAHNKIDLSGRWFGMLTVRWRSHVTGNHYYWLCQCDCGADCVRDGGALRGGLVKSCGCLRRRRKPVLDRLMAKVSPEPNTGCWLWIGAHHPMGYGYMSVGGNGRAYAHRLSYELHVGPIPDGMQIDHLCRVPACVNPEHLEPVTNQQNVQRGSASALRPPRSKCVRGHSLDQHGYIDTQGHKQCRLCHKIRMSAYHERRKRNVYVSSN